MSGEQPSVSLKPQMSKFGQLHLQVQALPSRSSFSSHHHKESTYEHKPIPTESEQAQEEQESRSELRKTGFDKKNGTDRLWRSKSIQKIPTRLIDKKAIVRSDVQIDNTSAQMKSAPRRSITYHQGTTKMASKLQPLRIIEPRGSGLHPADIGGQQSGGLQPRNSTLLADSITNLENRSKRLLLLSVSGSARKIDFLPSPKTESSVCKAALSGREGSASVSKPHQSTRFLPEQMFMGVFPLLPTYKEKPSRNPIIFPRRVNFSNIPAKEHSVRHSPTWSRRGSPLRSNRNPQSTLSKGLDDLHHWIDKVHGRFVKQLQMNNTEAAVNNLLLLTVFAVEADCADLFVAVMLYVVQVMVEMHETDAAFAVCQHLLQFCQMKHLDRPKIKILELMGTIAVKERRLECAIQLLAKAVEVCWVVNEPTTELQLYDRIGYIYYLLGELKSAAFFHDRFLTGKFEPSKSTRKKTAIQFNKSVKFVDTGAPKHEMTFESLHLFGFTKEYYDCIKTVMADSPQGVKRLYRFCTDPESHLDEHSEHFTKLVEGFGVYFTAFEEMESLKFTLLRCDNLGTAIHDYINEKIPLRKADTEDDLVTSVNNQEANLLSEDPYEQRNQDQSTKKLSFLEARIPLEVDRSQLKVKSQYAESTLERSIRVQHKAYLKKNDEIQKKLIKRLKREANTHEVTIYSAPKDNSGTIKSNIVTAAVSQLRPEYLMTQNTPSRTLMMFRPHVDHRPYDTSTFFMKFGATAAYFCSRVAN